MAIKKNYPNARITLLTSPGERNTVGAAELLRGAWYLDEIKVYYPGDIDSLKKVMTLATSLRRGRYDWFIHLPAHDWTGFTTMMRNIIFAKLVGVRCAFGFRVRTIINLFRKTQIDYTIGRKETETLLDFLRNAGLRTERVEFELPISQSAEARARSVLEEKWSDYKSRSLVVIHSGTKENFPEKRWRPERFAEVAEHLVNKHDARIVVVGGKDDLQDADIITRNLPRNKYLIVAGKLDILETAALIKRSSFLLGIDSGPMHIAAFLGKPVVGLFSNLNILGTWFPYGEGHEILYHRFLRCCYKKPKCIRESMDRITTQEVMDACDRVAARLHPH